ncbi:hypothetical protein HYV43_06005 [Candidatus Micrarchaeota archaeon]|nr:hypothetical protein [Candidatus Micrarchaeota archaeon]
MHEVRLSEPFNEEFVSLQARADRGNGEARYLLKLVERGLCKLIQDPQAGKHIPKRLIPKQYVQEFGVTNLWKLNLDSHWRMIYTLHGTEIKIFAIVLEVLDHKNYDRKFGYRTS